MFVFLHDSLFLLMFSPNQRKYVPASANDPQSSHNMEFSLSQASLNGSKAASSNNAKLTMKKRVKKGSCLSNLQRKN